MNVDMQLAYEVASKLLLEKEKQILDLTVLYSQTLKELEELRKQLDNQGE